MPRTKAWKLLPSYKFRRATQYHEICNTAIAEVTNEHNSATTVWTDTIDYETLLQSFAQGKRRDENMGVGL
jgi:hypothetical protein